MRTPAWTGGNTVMTQLILDRAQALMADSKVSARAMCEALGIQDGTWRKWRSGNGTVRKKVADRVWPRLMVMEVVLTAPERAALRRMGARGRMAAFRRKIPTGDQWKALRREHDLDWRAPTIRW